MIPDPLFNNKKEISQEERDKLIHFNTKLYWHCWYDPRTDKLYNEYCRIILDNAYDYLLSAGLIDKNRNQLIEFEK